MEIEAIKTWQWMIAGLLVGCMFSCIVTFSGPGFDTQARDTMEQGEFENGALALTRFAQITRREDQLIALYHKGQPLLKDVTVHPPIPSDPDHQYWVTGRAYFIGSKPADPTKLNGPQKIYEEWHPFKYPAAMPYLPGYTVRDRKKLDRSGSARTQELIELKKELGGQESFTTVNDFLRAVAKLPDADFHYQFALWELPEFRWTLPPLAGLLMIGVAWPLALGVLQNLGVAKPAPVKAKPIPPKPAQLSVRPLATPGVVLTPVAVKPPPPPPDTKKYGGEFYPVVKTTHKE